MKSGFYEMLRDFIMQRGLWSSFSRIAVSKVRQISVISYNKSIYETAKALNTYLYREQ